MVPILTYYVIMFAIAFLAGYLGSLVGIGGGIIIVPVMTLLFGIAPAFAAGTSLIAVIATSSGAGFTSYGKDSPANYRVGSLLVTMTAFGGILGAIGTVLITRGSYEWIIFVIFGMAMIFCALDLAMRRTNEGKFPYRKEGTSSSLDLDSSYYDPTYGAQVYYSPDSVGKGLGLMFIAGILSGLLGIGGGVFNGIAMNGVMKLPFRVTVATSNFMLGTTAAASLGVYLLCGYVYPLLVAPVAAGIVIGSIYGRKMMRIARPTILRAIFILVIVAVGIEMIGKGAVAI